MPDVPTTEPQLPVWKFLTVYMFPSIRKMVLSTHHIASQETNLPLMTKPYLQGRSPLGQSLHAVLCGFAIIIPVIVKPPAPTHVQCSLTHHRTKSTAADHHSINQWCCKASPTTCWALKFYSE